ncbi:MAG: hypothetical protein ACRER3_10080, partial [Pseudomonas fluorescens]
FLDHLTTLQGRLTTGCALIIAIVIGLWPDHARPIDPAKTAAIFTTAIAWLFAEISGRKAASAHDLKLFDLIVETIPQEIIDFLKDQDFGVGSYIDPGTAGLFKVSHWQGSRYDFVDAALNERWGCTHQAIRKFSKTLANKTLPVHGSNDLRTVHPTHDDPEDPKPFVQERIDILNEEATALAKEIDAFEGFARRRLGL